MQQELEAMHKALVMRNYATKNGRHLRLSSPKTLSWAARQAHRRCDPCRRHGLAVHIGRTEDVLVPVQPGSLRPQILFQARSHV